MSPKERLEEILKNWKIGPDRSWDSQGEHDYLKLTTSSLLDLFKEIVQESFTDSNPPNNFKSGANKACIEIIAKIEEMR